MSTAQNATHRAIYLRRRPSIERTLIEITCRLFIVAVLITFLRTAMFSRDWLAAILVGVLLGLTVLWLYERVEVGRRARADIKEAEFRGWLARVNKAASRAGWRSTFDYPEARWRELYAAGLSPEEAIEGRRDAET